MSRSTLNVHGLNLVLSTQAMYISVAVLDQRTISSIKVVCKRFNLKQTPKNMDSPRIGVLKCLTREYTFSLPERVDKGRHSRLIED